MCIAIYKPEGVELPSKATLEICWNNNPDGAGFVWYDKASNRYKVKKGFMKFNHFWQEFKSMGFSDKDLLGIHFRIATSGQIDSKTCHPFPIATNNKKLKKLTYTTGQCMMHNGIIGKGTENLSDTQLFVKNTLHKLRNHFDDMEVIEHISTLSIGSKIALFLTQGQVILTGDWIEEKNGIFYSNLNYLQDKNDFYWKYFNSDVEKAYYYDECEICDKDDCYDCDLLYDDDEFEYEEDSPYCMLCGECGEPLNTCNDVICPYCGHDYMDLLDNNNEKEGRV